VAQVMQLLSFLQTAHQTEETGSAAAATTTTTGYRLSWGPPLVWQPVAAFMLSSQTAPSRPWPIALTVDRYRPLPAVAGCCCCCCCLLALLTVWKPQTRTCPALALAAGRWKRSWSICTCINRDEGGVLEPGSSADRRPAYNSCSPPDRPTSSSPCGCALTLRHFNSHSIPPNEVCTPGRTAVFLVFSTNLCDQSAALLRPLCSLCACSTRTKERSRYKYRKNAEVRAGYRTISTQYVVYDAAVFGRAQ